MRFACEERLIVSNNGGDASRKDKLKTMEHNPKRTDTTLGELIAAASEVAFEIL